VYPLGGGDLVGRHRQRLSASEEKGLPKLAIPDRIKPVHLFL
jgi:hypothetical protein